MMVTVMVVVVMAVMPVGVVYLQHEQYPHPIQWVCTITPTAAPHVHRENIDASATRRSSGHQRTAEEDEMNVFSSRTIEDTCIRDAGIRSLCKVHGNDVHFSTTSKSEEKTTRTFEVARPQITRLFCALRAMRILQIARFTHCAQCVLAIFVLSAHMARYMQNELMRRPRYLQAKILQCYTG